jgi:hypothetical protein
MKTGARLLRIVLAGAFAAALPAALCGDPPGLVVHRYDLDLGVDFREERVDGTARVTIANGGTAPAAEASFLLYRLLSVDAVRDGGGAPVAFSQNVVPFEDDPKRQANQVRILLAPPLPPRATRVLEIRYGGYLAGYVETGSLYIQDRVDEAFTILREDADAYPTLRPPSHAKIRAAALPSFDYTARVTVPESHVVANGGRLVERTVENGRASYVYRNLRPAWRMDFAIAPYRQLDAPGLRVFALPGDESGAENVLRATSASLRLLRNWFGPLADPPTYTIIEIPDGWGSQADVTSILQTAAAFRDPAKLNEVYHEVSHLWNVPLLDRPSCRWEEGLASFLGALVQETLDGAPPLDSRVEMALDRLRADLDGEPRLRVVPMIDYGREEMTNFSYRTGMVLFDLFYRVAGPDAFRKALADFFASHPTAGATSAEFVRLAERTGGAPTRAIFEDWLYSCRWTELAASRQTAAQLADRYRAQPTRAILTPARRSR